MYILPLKHMLYYYIWYINTYGILLSIHIIEKGKESYQETDGRNNYKLKEQKKRYELALEQKIY